MSTGSDVFFGDWHEFIYGGAAPSAGDPAEDYHEASSLYPLALSATTGPAQEFREPSFEVETILGRPTRHDYGRTLPLPRSAPESSEVVNCIHRRSSSVRFGGNQIGLDDLGSVLAHSYGVRRNTPSHAPAAPRVVPSGGALYPLDLYVVATRVADLQPGLYHYDPIDHGLAAMSGNTEQITELSVLAEETLTTAGATVFLVATIWRSRPKYGLRAYRMALLEAGHVAQNMLLVATSRSLSTLPWVGFFDRPTNAFLGINSVDQFVVYAVSIGTPVESVTTS